MSDSPIMVRYEGDGDFRAVSSFWQSRADRDYVVGEVYRLVEHHDRSMNSHRHYFASLNEAWKNLPDELLDEYPNVEVLRKKALIRKGYAEHRDHVCADNLAARKLRAFIKPLDEYAIVDVRENVVRVWTAKSQSVKAMPKGEFQRSKDDVLDFCASLIGVTPAELAKAEAA